MLYIFGIASLVVLLQSHYTEAVCGTPPIVWRNDNITCPSNAICADVFEMTRNWYNGTSCHEVRTLSNCLCPGQTVCPTSDSGHMLYSSRTHKLFTCEPVCRLPWCDNIYQPSPSRMRDSPYLPTSMSSVQNAAEFGNRTYQKLSCRCRGHHYPMGSRYQSVEAYRFMYNWRLRRYTTLYKCKNRIGRRQRPEVDDPCPATRTVEAE